MNQLKILNFENYLQIEMDYIIICIVAFLGSGLTLFSGFGLGTLLIPVFSLYFPLEIAIILTAIVHFFNNIFKLILLGKHANKKTIVAFGFPAIIFSFLGAYTLSLITKMNVLTTINFGGVSFDILPVKLCIGSILLFFAFFEIIPSWSKITFDKKYVPVGGILSGFFGGLSGLQGALRTAFLIRLGLTKESFIATGVVIACCIDISRLGVYLQDWVAYQDQIDYKLVLCSTIAAFLGAFIGNRIIEKVTYNTIKFLVALLLITYSILLILGIL